MKKINKYNILAFILPIIILTTIYLVKGLFSKYSFFTSDSLVQFYPTYKYLYNVLHGNASFPYTFSKGLGGNMYGAFFYGLSSPINLFIYFFKDIKLFMILSTLLKIGLSSLTMFSFLKHNKHNEKYCIFFSLAYALSGYVVLYGVNIMWLDSVWLAPLVLMGVDKIIEKNKDWLYIITLLTTLISNYYTGYMVVIFSIVYFLYKLYIKNNEKHFIKSNYKLIIHFFIITLLIGGLIAFMLYPIFLESKNFIRINKNIHLINFNYLSLFVGTYVGFGNISNPLNDFGIIIYSGTIMIPLLLYYFSSKSISKKEKKASLIVLLFMLLPVIIMPLSYIWHLFTYPQSFNYRYSFLLILFILMLSIKSFELMDGKKSWIRNYCIIYTIISISIYYTTTKVPTYYLYFNLKVIIVTIALLIFNSILLAKNSKKIILGTLFLEIVFNISYIYYGSQFKTNDDINQFVTYVSNYNDKYNDEFYRSEYRPIITINNSLLFNYNGVTQFLSSSNKHALLSYFRLEGNSTVGNLALYLRKNTFLDTILGIKYISTIENNINYETIDKTDLFGETYYFQKNPYAFSLLYNSDEKIKDVDYDKYKDLTYKNTVINSITGKNEDYLIPLEIEKVDDKKFIIKKDKQYSEIYLMTQTEFDEESAKNLIFTYCNEYIIIFDKNKENIELSFDKNTDKFKVYAFDSKKFIEDIKDIQQMKITNIKNNTIEGKIDATKNVIATSIPYEEGWNIYIDGKKVDYYKILDSFIAFDITPGKHDIYLKYELPGFQTGLIISLLDLILFIVYKLKYKCKIIK